MKAIGIDLGTTGIGGILLDVENGSVLKSVTRNSNAFIKSEYSWEKIQDVDKIISIAKEILDSLISNDVCVIGVTGQMHGIVYYDKSGKAVSSLYTWQDGRGDLEYNGTTYAKALESYSGYGCVTDFYNKVNGLVPINAVGYCTIADYFVIAGGSNPSQIQALSTNVEEKLGRAGYFVKQVEGYDTANWILQDYGDIIVHIFDKENRLLYDLERIWRDGKQIDL